MSEISLNLPAQAKVLGALRARDDRYELTEDMLQIELPGDVFIDVGWFPDWDPNGEYTVAVYRDDWDNQIEPAFSTQNVDEVAARISGLLERYAASSNWVGNSNTGFSWVLPRGLLQLLSPNALAYQAASGQRVADTLFKMEPWSLGHSPPTRGRPATINEPVIDSQDKCWHGIAA